MFLLHLPLSTNRLHCLQNAPLESCLCSFVHLNHPLHVSDPAILISLHEEAVHFPFACSFPRDTLSTAYCLMSSVSTSSETIMSTKLLANYWSLLLTHVCERASSEELIRCRFLDCMGKEDLINLAVIDTGH
uniref:Uncharacterized protein n=1 Tax=Macaca nemestrina TaxID=9545 RepID=A0A2K6D3R5_MACNE